ncbi:hypothetical protein GO308_02715 [Sphingomonas sp. SFZ2018-12]|uniref:DUF5343 domain-containing protein n=1 Tax=Sphingomonas sp. SFZ2018-12 TaxID=2683197 RepID=UPI001F0F45B8|nr:DUF5343 domain-containing protein [Sphingomonas sp. SFZ2018-12]MCH4892022.1 hypothetical protein [Sphingomonas sp. SFZ2018-12]
MAALPYVTSPGNIDRALTGIKQAAVPERVSQDFVKTILKIPGGSGDQMTSFLKKVGFTNADGSPTDLYKKFRNPAQSGASVAAAIRAAYAPLYLRNEFMHELSDEALVGLVTEETGQAHDSGPVKLVCACIKHLKSFADFSQSSETAYSGPLSATTHETPTQPLVESPISPQSFGLNLGYTINLNLPATSDSEVFNAIFKSLKEHLLRSSDA